MEVRMAEERAVGERAAATQSSNSRQGEKCMADPDCSFRNLPGSSFFLKDCHWCSKACQEGMEVVVTAAEIGQQ